MKKEYFVIGLIFLATIAPLSIHSDQFLDNQKMFSGRGPAINFYLDDNITLTPKNIDKLSIYKIVSDFDLTVFEDTANAFDVYGETKPSLDKKGYLRAYKIGDDNGLIEYWAKTGVLSYASSDAFPTVSEQPNLPSDERAKETATNFLKENGFWTDDMKYLNITYDYQRLCNKTNGEVLQEFVLTKWVWFREEIDNFPITGAAGKITVAIGDDNKVVRFIVPQRTFEQIEEKPIILIQDTLTYLESGRGFLSIPRAPLAGRNITITNIYLTYYAGSIPEGNEGNLLVPSYYLAGKFEDTGQRIGFYIKAV